MTERRQIIERYMLEKDFGVCASDNLGNISGYVFREKQPKATKLNPLYAKTDEVTRKLLMFTVNKLPERKVTYIHARQ